MKGNLHHTSERQRSIFFRTGLLAGGETNGGFAGFNSGNFAQAWDVRSGLNIQRPLRHVLGVRHNNEHWVPEGMISMLKIVAASLLLALALPVLADAPYAFDRTPGRLPKNVVPTDYDLTLIPDIDKKQIAGHESVKLNFRAPSSMIQFDSEDETLSDVRFDGQPIRNVVTDNSQQLTTVTLPAVAAAGRHTLSFTYTGLIRSDVRGLFVQPFTLPDGKPSQILSSAFEPTDARLMFPCWDEPAFRARFQITVTVPSQWTAISNMPVHRRQEQGATATVTFERTPRIPTYLVHLTSGEYARISTHSRGTELNVWAIRGQEQNGAVALANARDILADYNDYFGYPFPLPKLDSIAIPGGFSGGMENWGAITYIDSALLLTPAASFKDRKEVYSVQAHEMAHQWNGDLVTMAWWDNLWLNESFASFMSARETAARNPSWLWWETQDSDKERAMGADAGLLSRPIYQPVPDEAAANAASDSDIIYSKGQAMLRMFEAYLGPEVFRDGVRRLMKARAFSNATSADLWQALSAASGKDVSALASGWTEQPGFPLIDVHAECSADGQRTLHMTQERFLDSGTDQTHARWNIPLRLRIGAGGAPRSVLFSAQAQELGGGRCDEPLSVNADTLGFYRVRYDAATLAVNTRDFAKLPITDRFALLDDQWALARNGREPLENYLKLAGAMGASLDAHAWIQIVDVLRSLETDEVGTPGHERFTAYARALIKPAADQLGWSPRADDSPAINELRHKLLSNLGAWGDPEVSAEAQRRFALFLKDPTAIAADDQEVIFDIVATHADRTTFDQLHALGRLAKDPALLHRAYMALTQVSDPTLAAEVAAIALSPEIPPQQNDLPYSMLFRLSHAHPEIAWHAFSGADRDLFALFGPEGPLLLAQMVPQIFWRAAPLPEIDGWLDKRVPKEVATIRNHYMDWARLRIEERAALLPAADRYVQQLH
jgi:aminopeptidase N